jgi:uncharacterized protein (TIGR02996 family)
MMAGSEGQGVALEAAVVANPDDRAAHGALGDFLCERGDPRGEFIHVQLALEKMAEHAPLATALRDQEKRLLDAHVREWLSPALAPHLIDHPPVSFTFARGWLDTLHVPTTRDALSRALAESPSARLLRCWIVADTAGKQPLDRHEAFATEVLAGSAVYYPDEAVALDPLEHSDNLRNLRVLQLGDPELALTDVGDRALYDFLTHLPCLEKLTLAYYLLDTRRLFGIELPNLRRLHVSGVFSYFLEVLGLNASLGQLTHLLLEPAGPGAHQKLMTADVLRLVRSPHLKALKHLQLRFCALGDVVCEDIVGSSILKRLNELDLQYSDITDEGATRLAACPDLRSLQRLDVSYNRLSERGVTQLRDTGIDVIANGQYAVGEAD